MPKRTLLFLALTVATSHALAVSGLRSADGALTVVEEITDLGGSYLYSYTLNNVAAENSVWWWGVYHAGGSLSNASGALGSPFAGSAPDDMALGGYSNVGWDYDFAGLGSSQAGILVGSSSTLSFQSDVLDTSNKPFFADITGEWAGDNSLPLNQDGTQVLSYMGTTQPVPEPGTLLALGLGAAAMRRRRAK